MLPGPLLPPPPPSSLVLIGSASASVPSLSPSDPPSSSIGSSLAIVAVIIIAAAIVTTCIVVLRRGCRRRRLSRASFSSSNRFSPMASVLSSADCGIQSAASAAVSASPRNRAGMSFLEMVVVPSAPKDAGRAPAAHSAQGSVKGTESVASSSSSAVMVMPRVEMLEPSAPPLPEVERVILELLSLPAGPMKAGRSTVCLLCNRQFLPGDLLLVLPVCSHEFHQPCIICWLRSTAPSCCPSCYAPITIPGPDKTNFCSDEYDIEAQMLVPSPPGEEVAEAVGGSRGWLRSSLDRLSGSWRGCSSNRATAVAVPVSSRRTTGSWSVVSSGRLGEEASEPVGSSREWLRSYLATVSDRWSGCSSSCSTAVALPVSSRRISTETLGSSGHSSTELWSRRWDFEAATPTPERPWVYEYFRWFFRSSG